MRRAITINGKDMIYDGDGSTPLLWFVRETADLRGTKFGCGAGLCGACTVHLNGITVRSCSTPMETLEDGDAVTTIEGLGSGNRLHPVQAAWLELDVAQCGYCQAGQMMSAAALLADTPNPSDQEIEDAMFGNVCRCGTYGRIAKAVKRAATKMAEEAGQ
ncbi:MAG: (2Fe-2S)-binding protein [Alphaproteobacteria bacterium]|nr:(2Fe-2S)-binding protein [Alphaproteobacteria bacterium]